MLVRSCAPGGRVRRSVRSLESGFPTLGSQRYALREEEEEERSGKAHSSGLGKLEGGGGGAPAH